MYSPVLLCSASAWLQGHRAAWVGWVLGSALRPTEWGTPLQIHPCLCGTETRTMGCSLAFLATVAEVRPLILYRQGLERSESNARGPIPLPAVQATPAGWSIHSQWCCHVLPSSVSPLAWGSVLWVSLVPIAALCWLLLCVCFCGKALGTPPGTTPNSQAGSPGQWRTGRALGGPLLPSSSTWSLGWSAYWGWMVGAALLQSSERVERAAGSGVQQSRGQGHAELWALGSQL